DAITAFSVSALYSQYTCPEGQTVNLTCIIDGPMDDKNDYLFKEWYFSKEKDTNCPERRHVRNATEKNHQHKEHGTHILHSRVLQLMLKNLTQMDSGGYCCYVVEADKKTHHSRHVSHNYMELQVKSGRVCIYNTNVFSIVYIGSTAAAMAIVSCVIGILCMPLILFLVYKQRKAITHRRAQELVRMD
ncbi:hypothetical protein GDO86_003058, partial [Hymenochirus boettgeri]